MRTSKPSDITLEEHRKEKDSLMRQGQILINWMRAALDGSQPTELPSDMDFESIYRLAVFHGVGNLTFYSVSKLTEQPSPNLYAKWQKQCLTNVVKTENQRYQRDRIIREVSANGIDLLPLKGCILMELYPSPDFRMMSDLDFLMEEGREEDVRRVMTKLGYRVERFGDFHDDEYLLPPFVSVEMHRHITDLPDTRDSRLCCAIHDYAEGIRMRTVRDAGNTHLLSVSPTEFYLQMILHFAKHALILGGSGIRSIMDVAVFLSQKEEQLDRREIDRVVRKLGLSDFLQMTEELARKCFLSEELLSLDGELSDFAYTLLQSGTYGTLRGRKKNYVELSVREGRSRKSAGRRYLFRRLFPPMSQMAFAFPILRKLPFLLPFFWIFRIFKTLLVGRDRIRTEIREIRQNR